MNIIKAREELLKGKTIYDMNLRVVNYNRVSTDKKEQLNSLINQENYFNEMINKESNWIHINSYVDEGISGTQVLKRENFLKMIEDAKNNKFDLIITKEISRFARNTLDSIKYTQLLLSYGVIVFFLSDNINTIYPDSEFRLTLMASMAQDEVRKLSERVKFGIKRCIKDGKVYGSSLYGYIKKDGKLIINEKEAMVVRKIFLLYSSSEYSFEKISDILKNEGIYTRNGKVFSKTTLKKMILNPKYKGWYRANMSEVIDYKTHERINKPKEEWIIYKDKNIPSIINEELWDRVNEIYKKRKIRNNNVLEKESYLNDKLYTSKIICYEHNKPFIRVANGKRKNNPVWECNEYLRHGLKGCVTPIIKEKRLNNIFIKIISKLINIEEIIKIVLDDYNRLINENNIADEKILKEKINIEKNMKDKLIYMYLNNMIDEIEYNNKKKEISNKINNLNKLVCNNNQLNIIKKHLINKLDIKNNIGMYVDIFIDKIIVKKINNNRKKYNLEIIYKNNIGSISCV